MANCKGAGETARLVKGLKPKPEDLVQMPRNPCEKPDARANASHPSAPGRSPASPLTCEAVPSPLRTHGKSHYEMPCVAAVMPCVLEQQRGPRPTAGVRVTPGSTVPRLEKGKPLSIFSSYNVSVTKCFRRVQTQDGGRNTLVISAFTLETEREFLLAPLKQGRTYTQAF